jgi:hypothetical protein
MSDMSGLSHEYASATDFSRQINDAVLLLKKRHLRHAAGIDARQLEAASEFLRETVRTLLHRLKSEPMANGRDIPEDVFAQIEAKHRASPDYFIEDLARLDEALTRGATLSADELELLDSICEAADASASATFRKLWRR